MAQEDEIRKAVLEERERCASIVEGWGQFEWNEGGASFCVSCNQALEVAKAIRNPEHVHSVEHRRLQYLQEKRIRVEIEREQ